MRFTPPAVAARPVELTAWSVVRTTEPTVPESARFVPLSVVLVIVLAPALLNTMALVEVVSAPTAPVPPFKLSNAPDRVPADWLIVPAFVAVKVTEVGPLTLPPSEIEPLPADVETSESVVPAVMAPVLMFWSEVTASDAAVPETFKLAPEKVVLFMVVAALLLSTSALAVVFRAPMAPVPPFKLTVAPITLPADWLMVPAFVAVRVTEVGPVTLPPSAMEPLPAEVDTSDTVLVAVMTPVVMF